MLTLIVFLVFVFFISKIYRIYFPSPNIDPTNKCVLISGCDSGFGNGLAIELDKCGFRVFAGVYDPKSEEKLTKILSSNSKVFHLDITKQSDIDAAFNFVSSQTSILHALVNNAGIGACGYIDWVTVDSIRDVMDVNFFGHVAMTKRFLPLLIKKKDSRVVNVCSVAGYLTKPGMVAYSASKYAFEAFSDALRREMAVWNLRVSIVEPGFMKTPIVEGHDRALLRIWQSLPDEVKNRWGDHHLSKQVDEVANTPFIKYAENPRKVIRAMKHAVLNSQPEIRYRPGFQSSILMFALSQFPAGLADFIIQWVTPAGIVPSGVKNQMSN